MAIVGFFMCIVNVNYVEYAIRGSAGPVFSLERQEKGNPTGCGYYEVHWSLVSILLLVMLLCCYVDVVGCFRGPLEPRGCLVLGEMLAKFL